VGYALQEKIEPATKTAKEIVTLEDVLQTQSERIRGARETEKQMGGLLLPNLYRDIHTLTDLARRLIEMKGALGYAGYMPIPQVSDVKAKLDMPALAHLSEEERQGLKEFSDVLLNLIQLAELEQELEQLGNSGNSLP